MSSSFDLAVIGTGSAAFTVASRCRSAGWQVAIVDSRPFGGTCALRGCDPKKVLVGAAELIDWYRRMDGHGAGDATAPIDWPELMRFKRSFTAPVPEERERAFEKAGIAAFTGRARFTGPTTLRIGDGILEAKHVEANRVVVATGARPASLNIPGEEFLITSESFLELSHLASPIVFIGGGYIAFEFAHLAARAGAQVAILHRGAVPLPHFDPDLTLRLVERTRALGVAVHLGAKAVGIEKGPAQFTVHAETETEKQTHPAAMVVHAAGRVPEIDDLDLDAAGVRYDPLRGVAVNQYLQSVSNPNIYSAGDSAATGAPRLTPVAAYDGALVAANLLEGNHRIAEYRAVPSVVFTVPPLASVGLQEKDARSQGLQFDAPLLDTSQWYSSRRTAEPCSGAKVLVERATGLILGAHLLGSQAEETINLFALAIRHALPAAKLKETLFAYPTHASDIKYML